MSKTSEGPISNDVTASTLLNELCILVERLNLALESGCSDTMHNFITKCAEYGFSLQKSSFKSQSPQLKSDAFRKHFIKITDDINERRLKQFSTGHYKNGIRYASLSLPL